MPKLLVFSDYDDSGTPRELRFDDPDRTLNFEYNTSDSRHPHQVGL